MKGGRVDTAENLLGKATPVLMEYAPEILFPIPRAQGRAGLEGASVPDLNGGEDVWHCWELSWLQSMGMPASAVGRIVIPSSSENLIESKSLKLYFNSLNQTCFESLEALRSAVINDLSSVAGSPVEFDVLAFDDPSLLVTAVSGECVDESAVDGLPETPAAALLLPVDNTTVGDFEFHSQLLRSLCPVTAQPDWATLWFSYRGPSLQAAQVLRYVLSFRNHQEFHEQCVERIFSDLLSTLQPEHLSVQALYTRRGGLDINPWRSTLGLPAPRRRTVRQ